ncbi:MAG: hypothetical protein NZ473_01685, partial [Candidatus Kapabacteria bacterium]|nr:hypothetical protein [Candidatus Kapabacteria bacterium]MDW8225292.1 hypothetical protein [Bacteroidota bacterium]
LVLLVPWLGYIGAAWATLGAYSVAALTMVLMSCRLYPVPYPWTAAAGSWGIAVGMLMLGMQAEAWGRVLWSLVALLFIGSWWRLRGASV